MRLHAGGALVVWPGMLFQNNCGYESHGQNSFLTSKEMYSLVGINVQLDAVSSQLEIYPTTGWILQCVAVPL